MRFLDSDVMVDLLRRHRPALEWIASLAEEPALPGFVMLELMKGCRDLREMGELLRSTKEFEIFWPGEKDLNEALAAYPRAFLGHGLDVLDVLIAASALAHGAILCTFNQKHYRAMPRLKTEKPYRRE
jgi:predicted nucleic acid-binding protein